MEQFILVGKIAVKECLRTKDDSKTETNNDILRKLKKQFVMFISQCQEKAWDQKAFESPSYCLFKGFFYIFNLKGGYYSRLKQLLFTKATSMTSFSITKKQIAYLVTVTLGFNNYYFFMSSMLGQELKASCHSEGI